MFSQEGIQMKAQHEAMSQTAKPRIIYAIFYKPTGNLCRAEISPTGICLDSDYDEEVKFIEESAYAALEAKLDVVVEALEKYSRWDIKTAFMGDAVAREALAKIGGAE
jgi:hypothetical protein